MVLQVDNRSGFLLEENLLLLLERVKETAAETLGFNPQAEVSLSLVDNEEMTGLNNDYRGINKTTDVLSFPLNDPEEIGAEVTMLGDIIISVPQAMEQANDYGHSLERELAFLFTHGLLHLLGYDHQQPREEEEMRDLQESILAPLGLERG